MLLISQKFLKYLKKINNFGGKTHTTVQPLKWDPFHDKFLPPNKKAKIAIAIHAGVSYLVSLMYFYHAIGLGSSSSSIQSMEVNLKCQKFLFFVTYSIGASFYVTMLTKGKEIVDFINGLIQIEIKSKRNLKFNLEEDTDGTFQKKIKLTHQVCRYQLEINTVMSISIGLGAAIMPSFCMNILFHLERYSAQFETRPCINMYERIGLFILNSMAWHMSTHTGFFFLVLIPVSVNSLVAGLYAFQKFMSNAMRKGEEFRKGINFFRQLQILSQLFGEIHRLILAHFLFAAVTTQTICTYFMAKLGTDLDKIEELAMSGFYGAAGFDTMLIIMVLYGFLADLHEKSVQVKADLLGKNAFDRRGNGVRLVQRFIKSCTTLKIPIGASNFLEKTSPLKFEDQIFVSIANLLLIQ